MGGEFEYQWESWDKVYISTQGHNDIKAVIQTGGKDTECSFLCHDVFTFYPDNHFGSVSVKPRGKKTKAKYAKAKKEWEDAQVIGVGDWVECVDMGITVPIGEVCKVLDIWGSSLQVANKGQDDFLFPIEYFRKLTPAEVEAHEASLVPEFEVGSYWVLLEDEDHYMKKDSLVKILYGPDEDGDIAVEDLSQEVYEDGQWHTSKDNLRPATPEEIKAATRTVWSLEKGDDYVLLGGDGSIYSYKWTGVLLDLKFRERGNIFLTRQEAEAEDARRVAANRLEGEG